MNWTNDTMATSPNLSYTSRDYASIFMELINSIPYLTKEWNPKDENDPGIVFLKMLSMLGDNLSYNLDKAALEAFPRTVLQRANAQQIFRLVGYKMHWWRSAIVEGRFTNSNSFDVKIARYNTFSTADGKVVYSNLNDLIIPSGSVGDSVYKTILIQGLPVTPILKGNIQSNLYNTEWHDVYDYNVLSSDIINNRIYLKDSNIDETSITLIDNDETQFSLNEWSLVKNINLVESMNKVFEFDVDEDNIPYIQLPDYWKTKYVINKFKVFYVLSNGQNGEIEENVLSIINPQKVYVADNNLNISSILNNVVIFNSSSTYGYNPQTCTEARIDSEKYINTIDTLVTLKDFERATMRIASVANVMATDIQIDPYAEEMSNNQINLWIVRKTDYNNYGSNYIYAGDEEIDSNVDEIFKENIIGELSSYKLMPYSLNVYLENKINWIDWTVKGNVSLRQPITKEQAQDLLVRINTNLQNRFNTETLDFNEAVNYMDVIECVMKTDKNIWHVDLNKSAIEYSKVKRNKIGSSTGLVFKNKYMIYTIDENENEIYTNYYMSSLGCTDIEINKLMNYDKYNNVYDGSSDCPNYEVGNDSYDIVKKTTLLNQGTINPGGSGYGKNSGNLIVREDGSLTIANLDFLGKYNNEQRMLEIYYWKQGISRIWDWTGYTPIDTNRVIVTKDKFIELYNNGQIMNEDIDNITQFSLFEKSFRILIHNINDDSEEDNIDTFIDTGYALEFDSRMYLDDGTDANRYLVDSRSDEDTIPLGHVYIPQLSDNYIYPCQCTCDSDCSCEANILNAEKPEVKREVWYIYEREYDTWVYQIIDKLTGEMFVLRGNHWYSLNRTFDIITGEIVDQFGAVLEDHVELIQRDEMCKENVTSQYIQTYEVYNSETDEANTTFEFYLGQDANKNQILDDVGNPIESFPIKPYSLYIYIDGDKEILNDTGSGKIQGTSGVLKNGLGIIDYTTGYVSFSLNIIPTQALKISYKVNKLNYANYIQFDPNTFYIKPEYIKSEYRK